MWVDVIESWFGIENIKASQIELWNTMKHSQQLKNKYENEIGSDVKNGLYLSCWAKFQEILLNSINLQDHT